MLQRKDLQIKAADCCIRVTGVILLLLFGLIPCRAQQTLVTGTVIDPHGIPYSGATIKANLTIPGATVQLNNQQQCASGGYGSAPCFVPIGGTVGPTFLDPNGAFSLGLYPNASIFDAEGRSITSQWIFTVTITPGVLLPWGTGPQTFSVSITIAGASMDTSGTLSAAAPALTHVFFGPGSTPLSCEAGTGDGVNPIVTPTNPQVTCVNKSGLAWKLTGINCLTDNAGTSTLSAANNAGSALLTGAITCNNTKTGGGAAGTLAITTLAPNDAVTWTFTADGTSTETTWTLSFTQ